MDPAGRGQGDEERAASPPGGWVAAALGVFVEPDLTVRCGNLQVDAVEPAARRIVGGSGGERLKKLNAPNPTRGGDPGPRGGATSGGPIRARVTINEHAPCICGDVLYLMRAVERLTLVEVVPIEGHPTCGG